MKTLRSIIMMVLLIGLASAGRATTVLPMNLARLAEDAESAFVVKIESVETKTSGTWSFDLVQGTVVEPVFGDKRTSQPVSWKQFRFAKNRPMQGMPTYVEGREYLVFLSGPASATGFQMPIGLGQGNFDVVRNPATGAARVRNEFGNMTLSYGMDMQEAAEDMAATEARTRGLGATARNQRATELKQKLRPLRTGNSLDAIKTAAQFFHQKKLSGQRASREYQTTTTTGVRRNTTATIGGPILFP